jgi:type IV secretory pathway VirB6-like protein
VIETNGRITNMIAWVAIAVLILAPVFVLLAMWWQIP